MPLAADCTGSSTELPPPWDGAILADEKFFKAMIKVTVEDPPLALQIADEALRQARARSDRHAAAYALLRKGHAEAMLGIKGYASHYSEARLLATGLADQRPKIRADLQLIGCLSGEREHAEALTTGYRALEEALHEGFDDLVSLIVHQLVNTMLAIGEFEHGLSLIREQTPLDLGDPELTLRAKCMYQNTEAGLLWHLALERRENGRESDCLHMLESARRILEDADANLPIGRDGNAGWMIFSNLCLVLLDQGDIEGAQGYIARFRTRLNAPPPAGSFHWGILELNETAVELLTPAAEPTRAIDRLEAVATVDHDVLQRGYVHERLLDLLCRACEAAGRYEEALRYHRAWSRSRLQARSRELREAAKLGRAAQLQLRGEAAEFITHDLRSPLASVVMQIDSLTAESGGPESSERLRAAGRSARRAMEIADRALHITRVDSIDFNVLVPVDLGMLVEELCEQMGGPNHARVTLRHLRACGAVVHGDWDLLSRALGNLIDNAIKHSPPGGVVEAAVACDGSRVEVSVRDRGPGMSRDMRRRMFQRYATGREGGYGLGLTLVSRVARLHKAKLSVETAEGGGTNVRMVFARTDA